MLSSSYKRVDKELKDFFKIKAEGHLKHIEIINKNEFLTHLEGQILGLEGTPYEGGTFIVNIQLEDYPYKPPKMKFITPIWHPNISQNSQTGVICLDVLNEQWSPAQTIPNMLLSISSLIFQPDADLESPIESEPAKQWILDKELFIQTAKTWTQKFAIKNDANNQYESQLKTLIELGYNENQSMKALHLFEGDLMQAIKLLEDNDFIIE